MHYAKEQSLFPITARRYLTQSKENIYVQSKTVKLSSGKKLRDITRDVYNNINKTFNACLGVEFKEALTTVNELKLKTKPSALESKKKLRDQYRIQKKKIEEEQNKSSTTRQVKLIVIVSVLLIGIVCER